MKQYLSVDPWKIVEKGFHKDNHQISESVFSIGNGKMGQRANFEEDYSGQSLLGNYIAGVYYEDKTRVGWWKVGYPEYFAKVLNAVNWISLHLKVEGELLDLNTCEVEDFERVLNMQDGYLKRTFTAVFPSRKKVAVAATRFYSAANDEWGALKYSVKAINFSGKIELESYIDFDVHNEDANYDDQFWEHFQLRCTDTAMFTQATTKKTGFRVGCALINQVVDTKGAVVDAVEMGGNDLNQCHQKYIVEVKEGDTLTLYKYAASLSSMYHDDEHLSAKAIAAAAAAAAKGFDAMLEEQVKAWHDKWDFSDIIIEGDDSAQQAIRFNIFQLHQTYTGKDPRLNIGPKGFTGEKYGGSTYWDTEAYCLPFYLSTASQDVSRNLLTYRYKHLQKAIENAEKLGFKDGAALYPMVTMNGEECHNEWEITFEEIHRNGAIAYAIYDYIRYTGEEAYLADGGLEVLIGIARFWAQRVNFSKPKNKYVMLGVTGPNEFENNVNNNWYTNYIATWCMKYAAECIEKVQAEWPEAYAKAVKVTQLDKDKEVEHWLHISSNMYFPEDKELGIYLQQDNFLDKEIIPVVDLPEGAYPIHQNWSWDRVLRSCYIKQADVLQGFYFFEEHFDEDTHRRNFDFYEPITVHESSLSPCVHTILAAKLGKQEKAYEMFIRTSRLDLDDMNNDTKDGCHITSMAGTWMALVKGIGGLRIEQDSLKVAPFLPKSWKSLTFKIGFRGHTIDFKIKGNELTVSKHDDGSMNLILYNEKVQVKREAVIKF